MRLAKGAGEVPTTKLRFVNRPGSFPAILFFGYPQKPLALFRRLLDVAASDLPARIDITQELRFLEEVCRLWHAEARFSKVQSRLRAGRHPDAASPELCRGSGKLSSRGAMEGGKQVRRFTARGLIELSEKEVFWVKEERGGVQYWACPKYDLDHFDRDILEAMINIVAGDAVQQQDLEKLGILVDGRPDLSRMLQVFKLYTVLRVDQEGVIVESHQDFLKGGQTEHSLWLENVLNFAKHGPLETPRPKRRLRAKSQPKPKGAGKAAPKRHPQPALKPSPPPPMEDTFEGGPALEERLFGAVPGGDAEGEAASSSDSWSPLADDSWPDEGQVSEVDPPTEEDVLGLPSGEPGPEDLGSAGDVPAEVHGRMVALFVAGGLPRSSLNQRRRNRLTSGSGYCVPGSLREALRWGYVHPNLQPPHGMVWRGLGGVWRLVPRGG